MRGLWGANENFISLRRNDLRTFRLFRPLTGHLVFIYLCICMSSQFTVLGFQFADHRLLFVARFVYRP